MHIIVVYKHTSSALLSYSLLKYSPCPPGVWPKQFLRFTRGLSLQLVGIVYNYEQSILQINLKEDPKTAPVVTAGPTKVFRKKLSISFMRVHVYLEIFFFLSRMNKGVERKLSCRKKRPSKKKGEDHKDLKTEFPPPLLWMLDSIPTVLPIVTVDCNSQATSTINCDIFFSFGSFTFPSKAQASSSS